MPAQKLVDNRCLKLLNMEPRNIPSINSHHHLMTGDSDSVGSTDSGLVNDSLERSSNSVSSNGRRGVEVTLRQKVTVAVLCFVNLINYMDRYTIAGILKEVQVHFSVGESLLGLLQTAFVLSYMFCAPVFGYLGDRYSRRAIMAAGVFLWSLTTLLGSFMDDFNWFLVFRALVGIGEASYSTIAPTIISDLFIKDLRSKMLALFYFAIPVGSGLGYIIGSAMLNATGQWRWALRFTPILGIAAVLLILFMMQDPVRGESEGRSHLSSTPWLQDLKALSKNRSFMLCTAGFTCVAFVTGALAWWGPYFIYNGWVLQDGPEVADLKTVSFMFGLITMISGLLGVPLGSYLGQKLRSRFPRADPVVCGCGLLISVPFLLSAMFLARYNLTFCYVVIFFGEIALNLNWAIVADIVLYVVVPTRRSTAEAFQILISHAFGDAGSPYLIGMMSESLKVILSPTSVGVVVLASSGIVSSTPSPEDADVAFHSLQYALFTTCFVEVLGGIFFLLTAVYIVGDKQRASGSCGDEQPRHIYADQTYLTSEQSENLVT